MELCCASFSLLFVIIFYLEESLKTPVHILNIMCMQNNDSIFLSIGKQSYLKVSNSKMNDTIDLTRLYSTKLSGRPFV